eukprot:Phypoly_transcript_09187.p1 GENE.Phypoly_transcript_09187~~Phypoly_transcript_09187.p1  ORF type:complete len:136 (-),score=7.68 Phypoly_transcript_09187:104-511(-)
MSSNDQPLRPRSSPIGVDKLFIFQRVGDSTCPLGHTYKKEGLFGCMNVFAIRFPSLGFGRGAGGGHVMMTNSPSTTTSGILPQEEGDGSDSIPNVMLKVIVRGIYIKSRLPIVYSVVCQPLLESCSIPLNLKYGR